MNKKQSSIPGKNIRNLWPINPVTRVHENDIRKSKKKTRQEGRKAITEGQEER